MNAVLVIKLIGKKSAVFVIPYAVCLFQFYLSIFFVKIITSPNTKNLINE